jgi:hypothetical protein
MHLGRSRTITCAGMFEKLPRLFYWLQRTTSNYAIVLIKADGGQTIDKVFCAITESTKKSYGLNMSLCTFLFKKL